MAAVASQVGTPATKQNRLEDLPWWTEADQAEFTLLVREFAFGVWEHRQRCASCARSAETGKACPHIDKALSVVIEWRDTRELQSRARWLRRKREELDYARDLLRHRASA